MTLVNLEVGIITGDEKRALEVYVDERAFRQRKSYDEYYCDWKEVELELTLNDCFILSNTFHILVEIDSVTITK